MNKEAELLAKAKDGDLPAIEALIRFHDPTMERFANKLCQSREDAEDSVQHARFVIAQKIKAFRALSKMSTWLYAVIKNECYRLQKKMFGFSFHKLEPEEHTSLEKLDQVIERKEILAALSASLSKLDSDSRVVLIMKDLDNMSLDEICSELRLTLPATKSRLHRARAELKMHLSNRQVVPELQHSLSRT